MKLVPTEIDDFQIWQNWRSSCVIQSRAMLIRLQISVSLFLFVCCALPR